MGTVGLEIAVGSRAGKSGALGLYPDCPLCELACSPPLTRQKAPFPEITAKSKTRPNPESAVWGGNR